MCALTAPRRLSPFRPVTYVNATWIVLSTSFRIRIRSTLTGATWLRVDVRYCSRPTFALENCGEQALHLSRQQIARWLAAHSLNSSYVRHPSRLLDSHGIGIDATQSARAQRALRSTPATGGYREYALRRSSPSR